MDFRDKGKETESGAYASMMGTKYKNLYAAFKEIELENSLIYANMLF
jgi:hypothetical protein